MSKRKIIAGTVLVLFISIQFIRPRRNDDGKFGGAAFAQQYAVPNSVNRILQDACYDCHSNQNSYPWCTDIQPVGWIMARHIRRGKAELNFSEFSNYSNRRQVSKLKGIANQIEDNAMPLKSYKLLHRAARLTSEEKKLLISWMRNKADSISSIDQ
ncbi:MAG: heme-binding domain-containing protein [Chitinophagaceae bacterium]